MNKSDLVYYSNGATSDDIYLIHNSVDDQKFQLCLSAAPVICRFHLIIDTIECINKTSHIRFCLIMSYSWGEKNDWKRQVIMKSIITGFNFAICNSLLLDRSKPSEERWLISSPRKWLQTTWKKLSTNCKLKIIAPLTIVCIYI